MPLYDYQSKLKSDIAAAKGQRKLAVLPTGGGKTVVMAAIAADFDYPQVLIAHRQELVYQISMAAANAGIYHRIIAPEPVVHWIVSRHVKILGKTFYNSHSSTVVTGVDTIIRRTRELATWMQSVRLWQIDEGHHLQEENKWGRAVKAFPNAEGIGWTGTPTRADGKSLKRGAGGCYDSLVCGPSTRTLINLGRLVDFKIYGPEETIDITGVDVTANGEFNQNQLRDKIHKQRQIVGNTVKNYLRIAPGKLGITFVVDIESANETVAAYRAAGVPAMMITATTPVAERAQLMDAFKRREFKQLVNVDICGEGTDIPAVEVISMVRPSDSFNVIMQQFGRVLRTAEGKAWGIVIDHAQNIIRMAKKYGLPDDDFEWSLDLPPKKRKAVSNERIKTCLSCRSLFLAHLKKCPECGTIYTQAPRGRPEECDGDLTEYSFELLASLRRQSAKIMEDIPKGDDMRSRAIAKGWNTRKTAQFALRKSIAWFGGYVQYKGMSEPEGYRLFFRTFGADVLTAQTLSAHDATELSERIYRFISVL